MDKKLFIEEYLLFKKAYSQFFTAKQIKQNFASIVILKKMIPKKFSKLANTVMKFYYF